MTDATQNVETEWRLLAAQLRLQREEHIKRLEADERLDPDCRICQDVFYPYYRERWMPGSVGPFAPPHLASLRCESGQRPHCTCDTCF